jgi:hypothetical protein
MDEQPVFVLRLRPLPGTDAIRQLRALLKRALRSHGFKCLSVEQEQTVAQVRTEMAGPNAQNAQTDHLPIERAKAALRSERGAGTTT